VAAAAACRKGAVRSSGCLTNEDSDGPVEAVQSYGGQVQRRAAAVWHGDRVSSGGAKVQREILAMTDYHGAEIDLSSFWSSRRFARCVGLVLAREIRLVRVEEILHRKSDIEYQDQGLGICSGSGEAGG